MIVVDTNVVSELMRSSPSAQVRGWVGAQAPGELCTTAVTVAEIRYGLERLPDGRRKDGLLATATEVFAAFSEFIHPFDADAATWYATIVAPPRSPRPAHRRLRCPDSRHLPDTRCGAGDAQRQRLPGNRGRRNRSMAARLTAPSR